MDKTQQCVSQWGSEVTKPEWEELSGAAEHWQCLPEHFDLSRRSIWLVVEDSVVCIVHGLADILRAASSLHKDQQKHLSKGGNQRTAPPLIDHHKMIGPILILSS